ncbi:MAG: hypothetical protein C0506_07375 [Anaerolinea sp.]|nr:hypothetical protein [Anaerolinea sp.]
MRILMRLAGLALAAAATAAIVASVGSGSESVEASGPGGYESVRVEQESTRISYVVFQAVDRDGFCDAAAFGAVSLHPVLTDAPSDTMINGTTGLPNPRATLDVYIDAGEGVIIETNAGPVAGARAVTGLKTFSTYTNAKSASPIRSFPPLKEGAIDECQAWVKIVSSLGGPTNVLLIFHDDTGDIGFDRLVNGPRTTGLTLAPGWSLVSWAGPDDVAVVDALAGTGAASGGTNVAPGVSAVYAWDSAAGTWLAHFPGAANVPGANTLSKLEAGRPYWFALSGSTPLHWTLPVE